MSLSLSQSELQQLRDAQHLLLSPLKHDSTEDWLKRSTGQIQRLMGADHAYAVLPGTDDLLITGTRLDPDFFEGLRATVQGIEAGHFHFDDPMPLKLHLRRRQRGPGVYHELALADRATIEESTAYQTLFVPHGVRYTTGLSIPLPAGEAFICLGFESSDAPGYATEAGLKLELLLPAFETGIRLFRHMPATSRPFGAIVDMLSEAIVIFGADGTQHYANRAFRALLATIPAPDLLRDGIREVVAQMQSRDTSFLPIQEEIRISGTTYRLRVGDAPPSSPGTADLVVIVEASMPYPSSWTLETEFGLTPREAEVALLLARGLSNDELADELFISPHTVRHHVEKVLRKLDCASRAAVAHTLLQTDP